MSSESRLKRLGLDKVPPDQLDAVISQELAKLKAEREKLPPPPPVRKNAPKLMDAVPPVQRLPPQNKAPEQK